MVKRQLSLLLSLLAFSVSLALCQDIHSPYPSRSTILAQADRPRSNASTANHVRQHTRDRTVLAYITPWNPKGTSTAEQYRGKLDIVAPTWHTVEPTHTGGRTYYQVGGAPPSEEDVKWMRRMQKSAKDGNGGFLPAVKISPRYVLDTFTPEDLVELLSSEENMQSLSRNILDSVDQHNYDGIVFECAAVWAIDKLVQMMAVELHEQDRSIVTVIPALRQEDDAQAQQANQISMSSMVSLAPLVDYVMVMTYDHAGTQGLAYKDVYNVSALPDGSPLAQEGVRCPGPNTPLNYLTVNIEQFSAGLEMPGNSFVMQGQVGALPSISKKILMGVPMYGYTYSVGFFDQLSNSTQGVPRIPPSSPIASKDNDTNAQAASREKARRKETESPNIVPVLRFPGEPFKHDDLVGILRGNKALVRLDEASQEQYIDYVAPLPPSQQQNATKQEQTQTKAPLASYYRAYFPSSHAMKSRLEAIEEFPDVGIAIWELGMAGDWLLHEM